MKDRIWVRMLCLQVVIIKHVPRSKYGRCEGKGIITSVRDGLVQFNSQKTETKQTIETILFINVLLLKDIDHTKQDFTRVYSTVDWFTSTVQL